MKLKINITKEVLEESKYCGTDKGNGLPTKKSCAVAVAICDLLPNAQVSLAIIFGYYKPDIFLPDVAVNFISAFDKLIRKPEERVKMTPFSFDIEVPDEWLKDISIEEIHKVLADSPTMELTEA